MRYCRRFGTRTQRVLFCFIPMIAAICLLSVSSAEAIVLPGTLGFTGGNGTESVDQYQGMAGGEWLEGWVPSGTITAAVGSSSPIGSGGNYLSLVDVNGGDGVTRQFVAPTIYPYRLMLDLRVDVIPTSGTINLSTGSPRSVNTNNTNYVQANASVSGNWRFHGDGTTNTSTIPLVAGTTYHFNFLVDPVALKYAATVSNGSSTYSSGLVIPFRNQTTLVANPYFELGAQGASTDPPFTFSLDNVAFAPEPSSHFTDDGSGSDWSTADNWDNGVPIAQTFAHIGAGNSATLGTTGAEAFQVIIGHTGSTLPGNGTLNQTGGDLTVANGLLIGVNTAGTSDISGVYTATGGTLTVGSLANRGNIILGYNSAGNTTDAFGTLNLGGASQFDAYLDELSIGEVTSSASNGTGVGTLKLAPTSNIDAREIMVSWSSMHMATQPTSTIELGANTTIKADTFTVAGFRGMALVEFGAGGGTLTLSGSSGVETDLLIANCDSGTNNRVNGHMDMSGGTFDAALDRLMIGYDLTGTGNGGSVGKLTFGDGTITANSLTLGDAGSGLGNGTLDMSGGSLTVNGNATLGTGTDVSLGTINLTGGTLGVTGTVTGGVGTSTLNVDGGTMNVGGSLEADTVRVGYESRTASLNAGTAGAGTVEIGTGNEDLLIGRRVSNTNINTVGTLDASDAASFSADVASLVIGSLTNNSGSGQVTGTLKLATASTIDAGIIRLGYIDGGNVRPVTGNVQLGNQTTIRTDTLIVGDHKGIGNVSVQNGGTLNLSGKSGQKVNLRIGDNSDSSTSSTATGVMDLSGGVLVADLGQLVLGDYASDVSDAGGAGSGSAFGTLTLSDSALNDVRANSVLLGNYARNGSGGSGTTKTASGTINMSGGTFAITGNLTRGVNYGTASGAATKSVVNVDGGTMTVGGNLIVDALRVGNGALAGNLTVNGETVEIGSETNRTNLYIARSTSSNSNNPKSTVDFSGAAQLTAYLDKLNIGERVGGGTSTFGKPIAEVILAPTTLIDVRSVLISEYDVWGNNALQSQLRLGADTTIRTDLFTIGGTRGNALVNFFNGGTVTLEGSANAEADLRVGYCTAGTTNATTGNLNLTGGTFNATLDELVVAYRVYRGESDVTTNATMSFDAGTVTANSVTLGWGTQPTSNDGTMGIGLGTLSMGGGSLTAGTIALGVGTTKSKGTLNFSGGTIMADSITQGVGIGTFNFTGGTLHVGTFGSEARPFDLVQAGGTLAPGSSPGMTTIYGNYTMGAAGALEIEINGLDQGDQGLVGDAEDGIGYDFVMVDGDASLAGSLNVLFLDGFYPVLGTHFDVLQTTGSLDITDLALNDDLAALTFGWWEMATMPGVGGEGSILRLSAVPEPTSLLLLGLALLLRCVRRRRR